MKIAWININLIYRQNKKILLKSLHNFAKKISKEDDKIREQAKKVSELGNRKKNSWIFNQADENALHPKDAPLTGVPKIAKLDPLQHDRKE